MSEPMSAPSADGYVCRYCRMGSDGRGAGLPELRGARRRARDPRRRPDGSSSRRSATWHASSSASPGARSPGPTCRWPSWTWPGGQRVYFSHHVLLWTEPATQLAARQMPKDWDRKRAGIPLVMMEASRARTDRGLRGRPGRDRSPSPSKRGSRIDVVEHHFLVGDRHRLLRLVPRGHLVVTLGTGNDKEWFHPLGYYVDRFTAEQRGLLLLHAGGNAFIRDLADDERIYVVPGALIYKDRSVHDEHPPGAPGLAQGTLAADAPGPPDRTGPDRDPVPVRVRARRALGLERPRSERQLEQLEQPAVQVAPEDRGPGTIRGISAGGAD